MSISEDDKQPQAGDPGELSIPELRSMITHAGFMTPDALRLALRLGVAVVDCFRGAELALVKGAAALERIADALAPDSEGQALATAPFEIIEGVTSEGITADDLVERAVRNAGRLGDCARPRWAWVVDALAVGSTSATALCRRFGLDPDESRGGGSQADAHDSEPAEAEDRCSVYETMEALAENGMPGTEEQSNLPGLLARWRLDNGVFVFLYTSGKAVVGGKGGAQVTADVTAVLRSSGWVVKS